MAAWLPGAEGGGVADVLFRAPRGAWSMIFAAACRSAGRARRRPGGGGPAGPLFPYGYGLTYGVEATGPPR